MTTTRTPVANPLPAVDPQPDALPMSNKTYKTLAQIRTELLTTQRRKLGVIQPPRGLAARYKRVARVEGRRHLPDFLLPDADGRLHTSEQLRRNGPLVFCFFRGGWSPFCTAELCALQAANDEFESVGATLAVVTPETRDFPRRLKRSLGLDLKVLSDIDYDVGVSYGVLFRVPDETKAHYSGLGFDLGPAAGHRAGRRLFLRPT